MLVVRLLGQFSVRLDNAPIELPLRSAQSLLAYLALTAGTSHRREKLAGLFWPDAPEASARQNLRQALWQLRRALGAREQAFLLADSHSLSFNPASDLWLDAAALQQAVDLNAPTDALIQAVSAYGGELLPGFYDDWVALERDHLAAVFERQMQQLLERLEAERVWPVLAAWAEKWLAFGQVPEPAYRALMLARAALGDLAGAAATYQRCVADLDRELGVEPSAQTRALFEQLRQGHLPGETPAPPAGLEARYELREEVGRGAMGVVRRAHDRLLDRDVAVKLLSHTGLGTSGRAQLLREAQAAARLQHPNIVAVFDAGDFNGTPAIVMELVDGPTLERRAPLATDTVIRIGAALAAALEHAHQHSVLHRDVKPGNIVIGADGAAKLMDFGLAYSAANSYLPHEEIPAGTALYMATEVLRGEPATPQSDLYALGATLYELATGRAPFEGDDLAAVIGQHLHAPLVPPSANLPGLPPALDELIMRLLAKAPADRPASASAVHQVLERLARGEAVDVEAPAPGEPPYRGLQAFEEADADWFFGREPLVAKLVSRLREQRLLAVVVGASGSGKSSVVRAGLVPALRRGEALADGTLPPIGSTAWPIHVITPTAQPLQALAEGLTAGDPSVRATLTLVDDLAADPRSLHMYVRRRLGGMPAPAERLLLVVDQFEELFTVCRDEADRRAFIDNLLYAALSAANGPTVVVLTLRADFYAHCAAYPNLREALVGHQEYIGPMSHDELRRAIEAPAERGGWRLEGGLVELLVKEVGNEPGALPLLSHALLETWQRRRGRTLTLRGYTEAGGVRRAIAHTAETVFGRLKPEQQAIARNVFLRLTELGEGTQDTRRRASRSELTPHPEEQAVVDEVLQVLSGARLITAGQDTVEVAHEALIREWPTLRGWLTENRDGLRLHRHLTETAAEWVRRGRDAAELYRGARLAQALEWAKFSGRADDLNELERKFLASSQAAADQEAAEREAQHQRELEAAQRLAAAEQRRAADQTVTSRRLRRLAAGLAVLLLIAAVTGGLALQQSQRAERDAHLARAHEWAAEAVNQLTADPERSLWLALHAIGETRSVGLEPIGKAEEALHQAVLADRLLWTLPHERAVSLVAFSADGQRVITVDDAAVVRTWDLSLVDPPQRSPLELPLLSPATSAGLENNVLALSLDGTQVAVASNDQRSVGLWNVVSGQRALALKDVGGNVQGLAFSPDGRKLAVSTLYGMTLWDTVLGTPLADVQTAVADQLEFSPDGSLLALTYFDGSRDVRVINVETGQVSMTLSGHVGVLIASAFSANGKMLVTAANDASLRFWDLASGSEINMLHEAAGFGGMVFSTDGQQLAVNVGSGQVRVLEPATRRPIYTLYGHTSWVNDMAYSSDGTRLVTASMDRTVKIWDSAPAHEWLALSVLPSPAMPEQGTMMRRTRSLAFATTENTEGIKLAAGVWRYSFTTLSHSHRVDLWDIASGTALPGRQISQDVVRVAFSSNGRLLASAHLYGAIFQDTETGELITGLSSRFPVADMALHPGGQQLALSDCAGQVTLYDLQTKEALFTAETSGPNRDCSPYLFHVMPLAFSPDGGLLAAGGPDGVTRVLAADSGRLLHRLSEHRGGVLSLAFSPDGRFLATGSDDATIIIWDVDSGRSLYQLSGHSQGVWAVAFSPDGRILASGSWDGLAKLWDLERREERLTLYGQQGQVFAVAFSPDGKYVAVGGDGPTIQVYLARLEDLVPLALSRVTRTLTTEECQQYLRQEQCPPLSDLAAPDNR